VHGWELATVGAILLGYAAVSGRLQRTPISAAMVFVTAGYLVGNHGAGLISGGSARESERILAESTLTLLLFADAARIDMRALRVEYALPVRLLGVGLPLTIVAGSLVAAVMFGGLTLPEAAVIGVLLAPTDAALGQAVVTDARLPSRIRQGLNVESGLNDGICVPLLFLALGFAEADSNTASASGAARLIGEAIGYGCLGGVIAGVVGALLLTQGRRHRLTAESAVPVIPVAAAAVAYGIAAPIGGSGFIAAFVGGLIYGAIVSDEHGTDSLLAEEIGTILDGATFILFGAAILGPALEVLDWKIALYAVLSLTVIRMAPVWLAMAGMRARPPTIAYVGWFGPRGLASIVFALIVIEGSSLPGTPTILAVTFVTVALSVFAHGLTAPVLTNRYAGWFGGHPDERTPAMESVDVPHQRWRRSPRTTGAALAGTSAGGAPT
jgi:NhaP-type Na+/H+ or K+/H+ antiporter